MPESRLNARTRRARQLAAALAALATVFPAVARDRSDAGTLNTPTLAWPSVPEALLANCPDPTPVGVEQILVLDAAAFTAAGSDGAWQLGQLVNDGFELHPTNWSGYITGPGLRVYNFWAPVNLPSGTKITKFGLAARPRHDVGGTYAALVRLNANGTRSGDLAFVDAVLHTKAGYAFYAEVDLASSTPVVINNSDGQSYVVMVSLSGPNVPVSGAPGDGLRGVRLVWQRQVSPSPAVPTFDDVPASHWAYCHIEALAASGITGGCSGCPSGTNCFCPDSTLTRAQMAAFLSVALGLDWPF